MDHEESIGAGCSGQWNLWAQQHLAPHPSVRFILLIYRYSEKGVKSDHEQQPATGNMNGGVSDGNWRRRSYPL
jgi:hypothetical protein